MSEDNVQRLSVLERRVEKIEDSMNVLHEIKERIVKLESKIENNLAGNSVVCGAQNTRLAGLESKVTQLEAKQGATEVALATIKGAGQGANWLINTFMILGSGAGGSFLTWLIANWSK